MVFVDTEVDMLSQTSDPQIIEALKSKAKKHGADALIGLRIVSDYQEIPDWDVWKEEIKTKRAEAKAIIFME
jgi:uncharacterized protein YbjQ (UPF0145 family)